MRSRTSSDDSVADLTRRRLDALIAELATARGEPPEPATPPQEVVPASTPVPRVAGRHAHRPLAAHQRASAWVADRLPAALQGRAHLGAAQFGVVALVLSVGLVLGAWWLVQAGGSSGGTGEVAPPRPVAVSPASAPPSGPPSTQPPEEPVPRSVSPTGSATSEGQIVVDVVGKVRKPGIAVLPAGSRVVDAVRAAGGLRPGVDRTSVNLARLLTDGEQIVVGMPGAPVEAAPSAAPAPGGAAPAALVNLNTADQATLETLPGVGPVTAAAILAWREEHGGFTSVDELLEVSGIGEATLAEIAPHVTL